MSVANATSSDGAGSTSTGSTAAATGKGTIVRTVFPVVLSTALAVVVSVLPF
jgi:hypothetical protein